ncbi:thiamine pyrophosphate-dependent dehydrogenase E1 component subunit alpha [Undibacter mobilis]|uniref:Thiamine pyrophosphate-dependent dehydrogenase E1 component subunit alpha n=1 Tax=Undibacter mobilis TaxID=2292256 RepID=A0A371B6S5_9BRAD|nr:thiamine pyrophosphate-dependent dehydrogenase E1 component subunit alpha [Undibacter mobilis]RDV03153.1 thiamine pyrophosphate-dependent dehydrogenase E1 component subunit alpha [Undibacter mobilis]
MSNLLDPTEEKRLLRSMLRIRRAEEIIAHHYKTEQQMRTPTHFGIGQEAVAVGVCGALQQDDVIFSHHRCHTHYLAKGGDLAGLVAELYGRATGCSGGRGGSVHLADRKVGVVATSAILGETVPVAVGSALAFKMDGGKRVAVTFFGDAVFEEGVIYESLNYAAVNGLPVLFCCENNLYSTETPLSLRRKSGSEFIDRVRSFGVPGEVIDGNDVGVVREAVANAVARLRRGEGPAYIECLTYRWREHVGPLFDYEANRTYRTRDELEDWMRRDPLAVSKKRLMNASALGDAEYEAWLADIDAEVASAIEAAKAAPWPEVRLILEGVL